MTATVVLAAALIAAVRPAVADQQYDVRGQDVYRVGASAPPTRVAYTGQERLLVARDGRKTQYDAQVSYTRDADGISKSADARFVQEMLADGSLEDRIDNDPDFLTILNQPFAIRLDAATMRDLRGLRKSVPFNANSPLGDETILHGYLQPAPGGKIHGHATVAVAFQASGTMTAPMPSHASATMAGSMRMDGTAYYAIDDAMLLALDVTLTISAKLHDGTTVAPVRIVYRRVIRASGGAAVAKTPRPAAPPSGGGTASPPAR